MIDWATLKSIEWWSYRELAGPVATVVASGVAVWVTRSIGQRQAVAAQQQAQTTINKLKVDLLNKKFEAYRAAMSITKLALSDKKFGELEGAERSEIDRKLEVAYEARSLFPEKYYHRILGMTALAYDIIKDREFIEGYFGAKIITPEKMEKHQADVKALQAF